MAYAIATTEPGGPEVLRRRAIDLPEPGAGELRLRQTAVGVNFLDIYFRSGAYPWPDRALLIPGAEGVGVIEALGEGVEGFAVGQRVAYTVPTGAYASHRILPAAQAVPLPDDIADEVAAAAMLKGLTVHYLIHHSHPAQAGERVLFHAAAGGVGLLACQWLAAKGVEVIATAGGPEKCALARAHGAAHAIDYRAEDFVARVREITGGRGVAAVYDSVGRDTILGSLDCLATFGTLVSFGQSSGAPDQLRIAHLARGSLRLTRPSLFHHTARRGWLVTAAAELFAALRAGWLRVHVDSVQPLEMAAAAHAALAARATAGAMVLRP